MKNFRDILNTINETQMVNEGNLIIDSIEALELCLQAYKGYIKQHKDTPLPKGFIANFNKLSSWVSDHLKEIGEK